ncbi:MAG: FmdB family zinc ribbon protein [Bacillota bacterium]
MPIYEYKCGECGVFEKSQRITEPALTHCPECGGQVQRIISRNINVIYKGSGFHTTDYRSENYKSSAKTETGTEKSSTDNAPTKKAEESVTKSTSDSASTKKAEKGGSGSPAVAS